MNVVHEIRQVQKGSQSICAAMGFFDGVHRGHQQVVGEAIHAARRLKGCSVAITFDPHPLSVLMPHKNPSLIYPLEKKIQLLSFLGVETVLVLKFDTSFSRISGASFMQQLIDGFGILRFISVGKGFNFGYQRSGNINLLNTYGAQHGFQVCETSPVLHEGTIISSTRVRMAVQSGDFRGAEVLLGRPYSLIGRITHGDRIGSRLGYPTANIDITGLTLPPHGVYAIKVLVQRERFNGVLNIGIRPTLRHKEPQLRVEAHLLQFNRDIYGERMEVEFCSKIREEKTFPSLNLLKQQIQRDIQTASDLFLHKP